MPKSSSLTLDLQPRASSHREGNPNQPLSPRSPASRTPTTIYDDEVNAESIIDEYEVSTPVAALPPHPPESPTSPRHRKGSSRSLFSNYKASKSSTRIHPSDNSMRQAPGSRSGSSTSNVYPYRHSPGSTPELSVSADNSSISNGSSSHIENPEQRNGGNSVKSNSVPHIKSEAAATKRSGNKHRFPQILSRSRSIRQGEEATQSSKAKPSTPTRSGDSETRREKHTTESAALRTAPLDKDRSFREMMNSTMRNRSADSHLPRHHDAHSEEDGLAPGKEKFQFSSSYGSGSSILSNIRSSGTKAAGGIGKAGKEFFGKLTRSGSSSTDREVIDESTYVCKVINLPLIEQTRKTRISKRLEHSKDKTEFWMPALPWRCIDYLNMEGAEMEGLYRVPGSNRDVKKWQIKFDRELDVNLFDESDLHDVNTVASMFKAWLRELPDEILPKKTQLMIAEQCAGAKTTPQLLKDELSKLPPFNYYLLFAITCHISLLHSCAEQNKMNYHNLCVCFQPCLKIEAFCFQFLVLDWRNCWQGCWTEKEYLAEEMRTMNQTGSPASSISGGLGPATPVYPVDERAVSSSGSSKPSIGDISTPDRTRPSAVDSSSHREDFEDDSATPTQAGHLGIQSQLPNISPMQPLSPIGSL